MKKILVEAIQFHEYMAQSFYAKVNKSKNHKVRKDNVMTYPCLLFSSNLDFSKDFYKKNQIKHEFQSKK